MACLDEFLVGVKQLFDAEEEDPRVAVAPRQEDISDVSILVYDLAGDPETEFNAVTKARLARFRCLSHLLLGENQVPVLPFPNPDTGMSHHIIRLIDSTCPGSMVDLLFRDHDLYFVGFRRAIVSPEGEENWGEWFIYGDLITDGTTPAFFNAVNMGISSSHRGKDVTKPGGDMAVADIFQTMSHFEGRVQIVTPGPRGDEARDEPTREGQQQEEEDGTAKQREARMDSGVKQSLERVVARVIIVFCEALRLRSVCKQVRHRLTELRWETRTMLSSTLWYRIKSSTIGGRRRTTTLQKEGTLEDLGAALPLKFSHCGFPTMTMADLIGPQGELMVAKRDERIISKEALRRRREQDGAANIQDPGFPPAPEFEAWSR